MTQYVIRDHARGRDCDWSGERWGPLSTAIIIEDEGATIYPIGDIGDTAEFESLPGLAGSDRFQAVAAAGVALGRLHIHADPSTLGRLVAQRAVGLIEQDADRGLDATILAHEADTAHEQMLQLSDVTTAIRLAFGLYVDADTKIAGLITPERSAETLLAEIGLELMVETSGIDLATVETVADLAEILDKKPPIQEPWRKEGSSQAG